MNLVKKIKRKQTTQDLYYIRAYYQLPLLTDHLFSLSLFFSPVNTHNKRQLAKGSTAINRPFLIDMHKI